MPRKLTSAETLTERLCRPQRIGVFGHRGVGKTTFLTMLYREAVGGRLPELRLAAADARTAEYLADKVLELEAGHTLPATLGETELHFHLYYRGTRLDLLFKDYQGEHVALGRQGPIRDFLRDCDAVWLCLDVPLAAGAAAGLQAQQEVEQLIEDYLTAEPEGDLHRPTALVLTKADLLPAMRATPEALPAPAAVAPQHAVTPEPTSPEPSTLPVPVEKVADRAFAMTQHALRSHSPQHGVFAVSSLGGPMPGDETAPFTLHPAGLAGPLAWLATALQHQDEARIGRIWQEAPRNLPLLAKSLACYRRRYPNAAAGQELGAKLLGFRRQRRRRRWAIGLAATVAFLLGLFTYDLTGASRARQFAAENAANPTVVRNYLHSYQRWHPTRHWFRSSSARAEQEQMEALKTQICDRERSERLAEVRRHAADPDADAEAVWQQFRDFRNEFPEQDIDSDLAQFRSSLEARRNAERERKAREAFGELQRLEQQGNLLQLIEHTDRFLRDHRGTGPAVEAARRREGYVRRLEERVIDEARAYSAANPLNFQTRLERYQHYLDRHPSGAFEREARDALAAISADWDRHNFRQVRDHYQEHTGDVKELERLCRAYLAAHDKGRFRDAARELLRWTEQVTEARDYRVVLKSGSFDPKSVGWFSRGLYLSAEIEVGGVRYGPSNIVSRSCNPEWDYEFPRPVRWKLGDSVRIIVTDHYYWKRVVADISPPDGDLLGMRLLSGETPSGAHRVTFESDFRMPVLPKIE
jgi:hypothetical protein